jgi:hypothetical protein
MALSDLYRSTIPAYDAKKPPETVNLTGTIDYRTGQVIFRSRGGKVFREVPIHPVVFRVLYGMQQRRLQIHMGDRCAGMRRRQQRRSK